MNTIIKSLKKDYILGNYISSGTCSCVFIIYKNKSIKNFVAKFIQIKNKFDKNEFEQEIKITKFMSVKRIGAKFYDSWFDRVCKIGVIVLKRLDITFEDFLYKLQPNDPRMKKFKKLYITKLELLEKTGIIHEDLHSGNIMIKVDNQIVPKEVFIIDWGNFSFIKDLTEQEKIQWEIIKKRIIL